MECWVLRSCNQSASKLFMRQNVWQVEKAERGDAAEAATSRKQRSDVRCQNFKVSPMATISKTMNNLGDLAAPKEASSLTSASIHAIITYLFERRAQYAVGAKRLGTAF